MWGRIFNIDINMEVLKCFYIKLSVFALSDAMIPIGFEANWIAFCFVN